MTFGVKFSASEVDDAFAEMKIDEVTFFAIIISILVTMTNLISIITILVHVFKIVETVSNCRA